MDVGAYIAQLEADGPALAVAADRAGWDAPVPATEWCVRDLVTHVGGVHRWAADIVGTEARARDTAAGRAVGTGPDDRDLLDWFRAGHGALVATLRAASDDLDCFAFLPAPSPLAFWTRRQAHETAVHRGDAERAAGLQATFPVAFAQDGIDEILNGFARRRNNAIDQAATVVLRASDGDTWTITVGGERIVAERGNGQVAGDVTVSGRSPELYQWLWNRPAQVSVDGDQAIAALWRSVQVRWS